MNRTVVITIICNLLVLLFVYTAGSKLVNYRFFSYQLSGFPALRFMSGFAWLLPLAELVIAGLLFIPSFRLWGLYGSLSLLVLFTGYLLYMLLYNPAVPCTCGGVLEAMTWRQHIFFNCLFIGLCIVAIWAFKTNTPINDRAPP